MNQLQILFTDAEFAEPKSILQELTLGDVSKRLNEQGHSIYEELYHLVYWQDIMLWRVNHPNEKRAGNNDDQFPPSQAPESQGVWQSLVKQCLNGIEEAITIAGQAERWDDPLISGDTVRERISKLAVHNAYHFGKIVMLRQHLGIWKS
jgi:DinB superfamily